MCSKCNTPAVALERSVPQLRSLREGFAPFLVIQSGSGGDALANLLTDVEEFPYKELHGFGQPSVEGHGGNLILGYIGTGPDRVPVAMLQGRRHLYEGCTVHEVVHPVRAMAHWGAKVFLLTNAAGRISSSMANGVPMIMTSHLNKSGHNPMIGAPHSLLGRQFADPNVAYNAEFNAIMAQAFEECGLEYAEGVYAGVMGPTYETNAEVVELQRAGADAVGMSTVNEVLALIALRWSDPVKFPLHVLAIAGLSNPAAGVAEGDIEHKDVVTAMKPVVAAISQMLKLAALRFVVATSY